MAGFWEQLQLPLFDLEAPALPGPRTRDERLAAGLGARRLLASILRQAIVDEALARDGALAGQQTWPWNGGWTPADELDAFWQSNWCANVCSWLDLDRDTVLQFVQGVRDGEQVVSTDKRRTLSVGGPGP